MKHTLGTRYILDLLYFLIVLIVLLNVIFGIIIDTFGDLRTKKIERQLDTTEKCFICGIDKQVFDRASETLNGFKSHIKLDHNMWNYLYFIIFVWEQDKDDDDGLEQYVRRAIAANDISWFPMNRAMRLTFAASAEEELRKDLKDDVETVERNLVSKLSTFQSDVSEVLEKIVFNLNTADESVPEVQPMTRGEGRVVESRQMEEEAAEAASMRSSSSRGMSRSTMRSRKSTRRLKDIPDDTSSLGDGESAIGIEELVLNNMTSIENTSVRVKVVRLAGLTGVSNEELETMLCRVITSGGVHSVSAVHASQGAVEFESTEIIATDGIGATDAGTAVQIQLLDGRANAIVGSTELTISELLSQRSMTLDVQLNVSIGRRENISCVLSIHPIVVNVSGRGR